MAGVVQQLKRKKDRSTQKSRRHLRKDGVENLEIKKVETASIVIVRTGGQVD